MASVQSGSLFSYQRLQAIFRLNVTKPYRYDTSKYTDPAVTLRLTDTTVERDLTRVSKKVMDGAHWNAEGKVLFENELIVTNHSNTLIRAIQLSLSSDDRYEVFVNDRYFFEVKPDTDRFKDGEMVSHNITFDRPIKFEQ